MKRGLTHFIIIALLGVGTGLAGAEEVSFFAEVDQKQVSVNTALRLSLTITGQQYLNPIDLPEIDGFISRYIGPSSRISIINGRSSTSTTFNYNLYAQKEGDFTIPSLSITIDGKTYTTEAIEVKVTSDQFQTPVTPTGSADIRDKVFIVMSVEKSQAFVNEQIPLTVKFYATGTRVSDIEYPQIAHTGFEMDDFPNPKKYDQIIGGVRYTVLEFRTHIYPLEPGEFTLGPAKMGAQILQKNRQQSPIDRFDSIFNNDDLFSDFFDYHTKTPVVLESTDAKLKVSPLPQEGRPADFSGAVGEYEFKATAAPIEVKVGDPVTLRLKVRGSHLKGFDMPSLKDFSGLKVYEPIIKEESGVKVLEQVVIPTSESLVKIPSLNFSYFDPRAKQYKILTQGPFPIKVNQLAEGEDFKIVGLGQGNVIAQADEVIGKDIIFIKNKPGEFVPNGYWIYKDVRFWICLFVALLIWTSGFVWYKYNYRLQTDTGFARKLRAPKKARVGIKKASLCIQSGQTAEFYETAIKTLREYIGNRFHRSSAGLTFQEVEALFTEKSVPDRMTSSARIIFESCDEVRYASVKPAQTDMQNILQNLQEIIDYLERHS